MSGGKDMKTAEICILIFVVCFCGSCRRHDYRTVQIHVPAMKTKACAKIVSKAVYREVQRCHALPEDKPMSVDLGTRTVTVTYDSLKMAQKNVEFAIAEAGFATDEVPADESAAKKLPPECIQEPTESGNS